MSWGWRHGIFEWVIGKIIGKTADAVTGGDPLSPDNDPPELEALDAGPVYPNRKVEGLLPRENFKELVERLDGRLDKGFRENQKDVLRARAARLKPDQHFVLLCNVYHGDAPTGLQVMVMREKDTKLMLMMEGRGPAMDVVKAVFEEVGARPRIARDGAFHFDEEEAAWRALLPGSWGMFLGQEVNVWVDQHWPGMPESGDLGDSLFLQGMMKSLKEISAAAERAFTHFVDEDAAHDVGEVWMVFPSGEQEHDEWYLQISRSNWEEFRWFIAFKGTQAKGITAGG